MTEKIQVPEVVANFDTDGKTLKPDLWVKLSDSPRNKDWMCLQVGNALILYHAQRQVTAVIHASGWDDMDAVLTSLTERGAGVMERDHTHFDWLMYGQKKRGELFMKFDPQWVVNFINDQMHDMLEGQFSDEDVDFSPFRDKEDAA